MDLGATSRSCACRDRRGQGLERWSVGALERWSVGALERWSVGALERWSVGALECWSVGVLEWGDLKRGIPVLHSSSTPCPNAAPARSFRYQRSLVSGFRSQDSKPALDVPIPSLLRPTRARKPMLLPVAKPHLCIRLTTVNARPASLNHRKLPLPLLFFKPSLNNRSATAQPSQTSPPAPLFQTIAKQSLSHSSTIANFPSRSSFSNHR